MLDQELFVQVKNMRVIRTGRKPPPTDRWSDAQVLQAWWEMEEQFGGRKNPLNRMPDDIPQLNPIPVKPQERRESHDS